MATTGKRTRRRAPDPSKCPDCDGKGEIGETVCVGARKGRPTDDRQAALYLTCLGTGEALD
ncbi:hypothetical protein ACSNOJ_10930 [Streptomyces sp. URMC 128]|uniref:hypothetical protein n=1 Tax=Streptomyces sp. URMC 128 TaxID=3423404 RepID=UPI003F1C24B3